MVQHSPPDARRKRQESLCPPTQSLSLDDPEALREASRYPLLF